MAQNKIRVADYITQFLASKGVKHVFLVTGGGAMHLNDAFGRSKEIEYIACHHEQACAMAAESYYRMSGRVAAVNVTTGPGGTNALTGVYGAYVDSCAMFVVSGQVKYETLVCSTQLPLRQLGDQEVDIVSMAKPVTKYAELVTDSSTIRYHLEKAWHLCTTGRPGPVWLDIPINIQSALIDPSSLVGFEPDSQLARDQSPSNMPELRAACREILEEIKKAKRPVVMAGSGIRISNTYARFLSVIEKLGIPVTTAFNAHDLLWNSHPLYAGRPGTVGDRPGNFAVQNADFVLVLGCRLNIRQISYNYQSFARAARIAMVDIDAAELKKPTLRVSLPVHADLKDFFEVLSELPWSGPTSDHQAYVSKCKDWLERYPVVLSEYRANTYKINPYAFMEKLFEQLPNDSRVVTANATACVTAFQSATIRQGQRLFSNSGCATMGFDLPAAIGACIASDRKPVICLAGDGSIQMNVQELQTIATHQLPIKIFLMNNLGYQSIKLTQQNFFSDNIVGCGTDSGLGFPDFEKLAAAYRLPYLKAEKQENCQHVITQTLQAPGPVICEVSVDERQPFAPKLSSRRLPDGRMVSSPLEDMAPFLPRDEFKANMIIPVLDD
ncbi:MAG: thiamine pyrophosphate-binding protein [Oligoflexia bacterium]